MIDVSIASFEQKSNITNQNLPLTHIHDSFVNGNKSYAY